MFSIFIDKITILQGLLMYILYSYRAVEKYLGICIRSNLHIMANTWYTQRVVYYSRYSLNWPLCVVCFLIVYIVSLYYLYLDPYQKKRMEQICRYVFLNSCFIFSYYYYRQNYSANIMCLCLIHTASIEELEELAETHLLGFLNKNSPERIWPNRPFKPKQMRTKIFVVPVKEVCHVNLTFPMEDISSW